MKKKGKFSTFIFSMMPGAGHMYLGFMKQGVSIMTGFFGVAFLSMILSFEPFLFIIPVIWFYSFFDAMNKNGLSDEQFSAQEDHFLFNLEKTDFRDFNLGKFRLLFAFTLIIIGSNLLLSNLVSLLSRFLPDAFSNMLYYLSDMLPEVFIGVVIILIGIKLIVGKNTELKKESLLQIQSTEEQNHDQNA